MENIRRDDSNVRFSRRLAIILMSVVTVLVLVTGVTAVWISREHNTLSETGTKRMISGGISAFENQLQATILDYSLWAPAYAAITQAGYISATSVSQQKPQLRRAAGPYIGVN